MINSILGSQEMVESGQKLLGSEGNDTISGGEDNDTIHGSNGDDSLAGNGGNDRIFASHGDDQVAGGDGDDKLWGNNGNDNLFGDDGNDTIIGEMGEDTLNGGSGNDRLISRSDAGEPDIAQDSDQSQVYPNQPFLEADDLLIGGSGADTFRFELLINAKQNITQKHADLTTGQVNWKAVAHENDNVHDHWVDSIGNDAILDFNKSEGDKIQIAGHTVEVSKIDYVDVNKDGTLESIIHLISNQGANGGAHNQDQLGTITVYGDQVESSDLRVDAGVFYGAFNSIYKIAGSDQNDLLSGTDSQDTIDGGDGNDSIFGKAGNDRIFAGNGDDQVFGEDGDDKLSGGEGDDTVFAGEGNDRIRGNEGKDTLNGGNGDDRIFGGQGNDSLVGEDGDDKLWGGEGDDTVFAGEGNDRIRGGEGNDILNGGDGDDKIYDGMGEDVLNGGDGNDRLFSRSDAGEPDIAQETDEAKIYPDQPFLEANDTLIGGAGADSFRFELLLNAKDAIVEKHADPITGKVNWQAIAHKNDNVHDHWVDGIGNDVILDFNKSEGDNIRIAGHTVEVSDIEYVDLNQDQVLESIIHLISNQGANGGAHNQDELGSITVYGDLVEASDLRVNAGVFYGAFNSINDIA